MVMRYARLYDHRLTPNNLVFVGRTAYNYDHERKPHEGDDWNQSPPSDFARERLRSCSNDK